ncbi:hypothetical protein GCM10009736_52060 [Actinomadura bangladeshensis]
MIQGRNCPSSHKDPPASRRSRDTEKVPPACRDRRPRAADSLAGLPVGDASDQFFLLANRCVAAESGVPPAP